MSLDLTGIASQVGGMAARLKANSAEKQRHLEQALATANDEAIDLDELNRKIAGSKTTWLVAGLVDGLSRHYPPPPFPAEFTVLATDGSHMDVDRNRPARCYLINI
ncbi:MAG: nuclease, partial [Chloroflexi bacterium]|nr:nuclease [Chloroflexota bacterium]